jgi:hypothetical protein
MLNSQQSASLNPARRSAISRWLSVVLTTTAAAGMGACMSDSTTREEPPVESESHALVAADNCGDQCGISTLATGEACCRNGGERSYKTDTKCCTRGGVQQKYPVLHFDACPEPAQHKPQSPNGCSTQLALLLGAVVQPVRFRVQYAR